MKKIWQTLKNITLTDIKDSFKAFQDYQKSLKSLKRKDLTEQLKTAVANNNVEAVAKLTKYQHIPFIKKPSIRDNNSQLIFTALKNKSFDIAKILVKKGIITDVIDTKAFKQAIIAGDSETVLLMNKGNKFLRRFSYEYFELAARTSNLELVNTMAKKVTNEDYTLNSMLKAATYAKQMDNVALLQNEYGQTYNSYDTRLLEYFAKKGDMEMTTFLMEQGLNPLGSYGQPMEAAKSAGHRDIWLKMREHAYKGKAPVTNWSINDRNTVVYSQYDVITDTSIKYCFNFKTEVLTTAISDPAAEKPQIMLKEEFNKMKGGEKKLLATAQDQLQKHIAQIKK